MKPWRLGCFALLLTPSAFAQAPIPTPSSSSSSNSYILYLSAGTSRVVASSVALGPESHYTASSGCTGTFRDDGAITCLMANTCPGQTLPLCGVTFRGPPGLSLSDVAELQNVTATNSSAGSSSSTAGAIRAQDIAGIDTFTDNSGKQDAFLRH
jgi:hypothetical protein